jgi:hypothetical protein
MILEVKREEKNTVSRQVSFNPPHRFLVWLQHGTLFRRETLFESSCCGFRFSNRAIDISESGILMSLINYYLRDMSEVNPFLLFLLK